jgi:hypothetical protein
MSLFLPPAENHEQALKKAALQVEPSLQKGASGNAPEKEPEKQGIVGRRFTHKGQVKGLPVRPFI